MDPRETRLERARALQRPWLARRRRLARAAAKREFFRAPRPRRMQLYIDSLDLFHPWESWSSNNRAKFLLERKSNEVRFDLAKFFLLNGLEPQHLFRFVLLSDVTRGGVPVFQDDDMGKYMRHIRQMIAQFRARDPRFFSGKYYDLHAGRVRPGSDMLDPPEEYDSILWD